MAPCLPPKPSPPRDLGRLQGEDPTTEGGSDIHVSMVRMAQAQARRRRQRLEASLVTTESRDHCIRINQLLNYLYSFPGEGRFLNLLGILHPQINCGKWRTTHFDSSHIFQKGLAQQPPTTGRRSRNTQNGQPFFFKSIPFFFHLCWLDTFLKKMGEVGYNYSFFWKKQEWNRNDKFDWVVDYVLSGSIDEN